MKPAGKVKTLRSIRKDCYRAVLRKAREEAGLTQEKFAKKIQQTQSFVSRYESGRRGLAVLEWIDISAALGMKLTTFGARYEEELKRALSGQARAA